MRAIIAGELICSILILMLSSLVQADVYRCVDGFGESRYQDARCLDDEQSEVLDLHPRKQPTAVNADPAPTDDGRQNLVQNAHFDHDLRFWTSRRNAQAFHWIGQDGDTKQGAVSVQSTPPQNQKKRIIYDVTLSQCMKLDRGRRYRFAASFKAMGAYTSRHANRVNLIWYQSEDCTTQGQFAEYLEPDPNIVGWQRITRNNKLRSLNARAALITIGQSRIGGNRQPAFWDDIELTPTECVNIGTNKVFMAGANVMIDPVSTQEGGGIFRLSWFTGENCQGRSQAGFKEARIRPVPGWQTLTIDRIEAPPGAQSASIYITRGVNDTGLFAYLFDDVYFKARAE